MDEWVVERENYDGTWGALPERYQSREDAEVALDDATSDGIGGAIWGQRYRVVPAVAQ